MSVIRSTIDGGKSVVDRPPAGGAEDFLSFMSTTAMDAFRSGVSRVSLQLPLASGVSVRW
ncbi:hypothetical protein [Rhodococcus sp. ACPA4]|uniref:hypothetical protein n=1 Tax=Rhodococcus sp. ACPA4 TaxID=2028571 RepID=UPI00211B8D65|nr:hypothetical protein [Rhodococcus sp. ACPA4]